MSEVSLKHEQELERSSMTRPCERVARNRSQKNTRRRVEIHRAGLITFGPHTIRHDVVAAALTDRAVHC